MQSHASKTCRQAEEYLANTAGIHLLKVHSVDNILRKTKQYLCLLLVAISDVTNHLAILFADI